MASYATDVLHRLGTIDRAEGDRPQVFGGWGTVAAGLAPS
jgi:hypothetical protein